MKKVSLLLSVLILFALTACENHVHDDDHDHEEASGLKLRANGEVLVVYNAPNAPVGSLSVVQNATSPLISVVFIAEDGDEFTPDEPEYSLELETTGTAIGFVQNTTNGKWGFQVQGNQVGSATFVVKLMHNDHADFRSQPITVNVTASAIVQ